MTDESTSDSLGSPDETRGGADVDAQDNIRAERHRRSSPEPRSIIRAGSWMRSTGRPGWPRRARSRAALRRIMAQAQASGLLNGRPAEPAEQFGGLLWGNLLVSLLLGVAERPSSRELAARARDTTTAFLQLHPLPTESS